jgi:uncharacterized protein
MRGALGAVVTLVAALAWAAAPAFPSLTGRVVDAANILRADTETALTAQLAAWESQSGTQIVVVTVPDLGGLDIAEYGYQLGRHWGIGDRKRNTGALLIVAPAQRQVRIEVGYGLEGELTDAASAQIIHDRVLPRFRAGDFDAGVRAGVAGMIAVLDGEAPNTAVQTVKHLAPGAIFWFIVLVIVLSSFSGPRSGGLARAVFWGSVLRGLSQGGRGGGGFHGGGGGFHGGGGSFGGGGASGSW